MIVKFKANGKLINIPDKDLALYDPSLFEQVDQPQTQQPNGNMGDMLGNAVVNGNLGEKIGTFAKGVGSSMAKPFVNTFNRVGGAQYEIGRAGKMTLADILNAVGAKGLGEKLYQSAAETNPYLKTEADVKTASDPLQMAKDSAALLSYGVPVGGATKIGGQVLKTGVFGGGALSGALQGFSNSGTTAESMLGNTLLGGAVGGVSSVALNKLLGLGKGMQKAGQGMENTAATQRLNRISLKKWGGTEFLNKLDDNGLSNFADPEDLATQAQALLNNNSDELAQAFAGAKGQNLSTKTVLDKLDDIIASKPAGDARAPFEAVRQQFLQDVGKSKTVDFATYLTLRRNYGALGKWKMGGEIGAGKAGAYEQVYKVMNDELDKALSKSGYESFRQMNKGISTAIDALDVADEALRKIGNSGLTLTDIIAGAGGAGGGIPGSIAAIGAKRALNSPATLSATGKAVGGLGKAMSNVAPNLQQILSRGAPIVAANKMTQPVSQAQVAPTMEEPDMSAMAPSAGGVQQGAITPEILMLGRATLTDEEYKKLKDIYDIQQEMGGGPTDAAGRKRQMAMNTAEGIYSQLEQLATDAPAGLPGWLQAGIGAVPGVEGGSSEDLKRVSEGYARAIASALASEVGVATDRDVARWMGLMPKVGDTRAERMRALARLRKQIDAEKNQFKLL